MKKRIQISLAVILALVCLASYYQITEAQRVRGGVFIGGRRGGVAIGIGGGRRYGGYGYRGYGYRGYGYRGRRFFGPGHRWRFATYWGDPGWRYARSRWIIRNETNSLVTLVVRGRETYLRPGEDIEIRKSRNCFFTVDSSDLGSGEFENCHSFLSIIEDQDQDGNTV